MLGLYVRTTVDRSGVSDTQEQEVLISIALKKRGTTSDIQV